jgi:hypothetical protein
VHLGFEHVEKALPAYFLPIFGCFNTAQALSQSTQVRGGIADSDVDFGEATRSNNSFAITVMTEQNWFGNSSGATGGNLFSTTPGNASSTNTTAGSNPGGTPGSLFGGGTSNTGASSGVFGGGLFGAPKPAEQGATSTPKPASAIPNCGSQAFLLTSVY